MMSYPSFSSSSPLAQKSTPTHLNTFQNMFFFVFLSLKTGGGVLTSLQMAPYSGGVGGGGGTRPPQGGEGGATLPKFPSGAISGPLGLTAFCLFHLLWLLVYQRFGEGGREQAGGVEGVCCPVTD